MFGVALSSRFVGGICGIIRIHMVNWGVEDRIEDRQSQDFHPNDTTRHL